MEHRFRQKLEKFVGVDKPPTIVISAFEAAEFTATRVRWDEPETGHPTNFDRADGYLICLQRKDVAAQPYWVDQRARKMGPMRQGQFLLLDLNLQHSSITPGNIDCVSIFVSHDALNQYQVEHGLPHRPSLQAPIGSAVDDLVIRNLGECLLAAIEEPESASRLYTDHVALALLSRLSSKHAAERPPVPRPPSSLATWQERRAKDVLMSHLNGGIRLDELAAECRLSRSHFARAFKQTTGMSPMRWLMAQRIACAKDVLLNTDLSLEDIADQCGFADSSHFVRSFARETGASPGSWRRSHRA